MNWLADNWLDLFGWAGSALLIVSLLQARVLRFRVLNLVASLSLVAFNAFVGVWPMVGMNVVISVINAWFILRLLRDRHDSRVFDVLQVSPDDAYYQHFQRGHAADISRTHSAYDGLSLTTWRSRSSGATRPSAWCWFAAKATWPGCSWTT